MNSIALTLFQTSGDSLFMGLCLMLGLLSAGLSIGFFSILRHKALLYFGVMAFIVYVVVGVANANPQQLYDLDGHGIFLRVMHALLGVAIYLHYRLFLSIFSPLPRSKYLHPTIFASVTFLALVARALVVISLDGNLIRLSSLLTATFLTTLFFYCLAYSASVKSVAMIKLGCCVFTGIITYPLTRAGILQAAPSDTAMSFLLLTLLSIFSALWLYGLIEMARELFENAEIASLKKMTTAFLHLRDLMNTPLQTIGFSIAILHEKNVDLQSTLKRMESAFRQMRKISELLESESHPQEK